MGVFSEVLARVSTVESTTAAAVEGVRRQLAEVEAHAAAAEGAVRASLERTKSALDEVDARVSQSSGHVTSILGDLNAKTVSTLDALRAQLEELPDSTYVDELRKQLDALAVGGGSLQEFLKTFGDVQIGAESIRDILAGIDIQGYERDFQALAVKLRTGAADFADVTALLKERGGEFADQIAGWFDALKSGKLGVEDLLTKVTSLQQGLGGLQGPGGSSDFLGALIQALRGAQAGGTL